MKGDRQPHSRRPSIHQSPLQKTGPRLEPLRDKRLKRNGGDVVGQAKVLRISLKQKMLKGMMKKMKRTKKSDKPMRR